LSSNREIFVTETLHTKPTPIDRNPTNSDSLEFGCVTATEAPIRESSAGRAGHDGVEKLLTLIRDNVKGFAASRYQAYVDLTIRLREAINSATPRDATIAVVSKGDGELLKLGRKNVWHFPRADDGSYAGHYPPNSAAAIEHLESIRSLGADYLVFPGTAFWWFEFYQDFTRHLATHYSVAHRDAETCVAFSLRTPKQASELTNCEMSLLPEADTLTWCKGICHATEDIIGQRAEIDEACEYLRSELQVNPDDANVLIDLATLEIARRNAAIAEQLVANALKKSPHDYEVHFEAARLAWQQEKYAAVDERITCLLTLLLDDVRAENQIVRLACSRIEQGGNVTSKRFAKELVSFLANPSRMRRLPAETKVWACECLAELNETKLALGYLEDAIGQLDCASECIQAFTLRLLRPAIGDRRAVPFDDSRALVMFLTHAGNGFASSHNSYKAEACYLLAANLSEDLFAAEFNLAFRALADGDVNAARRNLCRATRVAADDASQICWPMQNGTAWPRSRFDLAEAFEKLKPSGAAWPKITVITPSFNQAAYVEETILSVLNQHYPELEYIVVDGGSTDGSDDVLRRYEPSLTKLIIEPDEGQTDAINKGLRLATGDLITWINSDDLLAPGALFAWALAHIEQGGDVIAGFCAEHNDRSFGLINLPVVTQETFNVKCLGEIFQYWLKGHYFYQPEVMFTRRVLASAGGSLDKALHYTMDYEFWMQSARAGARVTVIRWPMALFRRHAAQKTSNMDATVIEQARVRDRFVIPHPSATRESDIRRRLCRALSGENPRVCVVSGRAETIFSPNTSSDLQQTFCRQSLNVDFAEKIDPTEHRKADLIILLLHLLNEQWAVRKLRELNADVPIIGWFWDNHHHVFDNHKALADLDVIVPGHGFAASYLRTSNALMTPAESMCVAQWTKSEASEFFQNLGDSDRSDDLYGGFVRYEGAPKRNRLIDDLVKSGFKGVKSLEGSDIQHYFGLLPKQRFQEWASHKVSLCLPLAGDVSLRLFDALLTGQIPIVPRDVWDLDSIIPESIQAQLPVVRFDDYSVDDVTRACNAARKLFDELGYAGVTSRHRYALENHMFVSSLQRILATAQGLAQTTK
jgi:tetratricopeptide (TPR) repeat protein